jgi:hypothetical protein
VSGRVSSELLLVGSPPAELTDDAVRAGGELFGHMVFALPTASLVRAGRGCSPRVSCRRGSEIRTGMCSYYGQPRSQRQRH